MKCLKKQRWKLKKQASEIFWWKNNKKYDCKKKLGGFHSRLESIHETIKILEDGTK